MATKTQAPKTKLPLQVVTLTHDDATRKNIPTAEFQSVMAHQEQRPVRVQYPRAISQCSAEHCTLNLRR